MGSNFGMGRANCTAGMMQFGSKPAAQNGFFSKQISVISNAYLDRVQLKRDAIENFDAYPFSLPAVRTLDALKLHPKVTFLIGENGSGKSTLLEAIAVASGFNAEGGTTNFKFSTRGSHSHLHEFIRLSKGLKKPRDGFFQRAESFFNVATEIERMDAEPSFAPPVINSYGGKSLHELSHGEAFLALVMNRFGGQGLYLLDEPEAALSPARQLAVLTRIHDLVHNKSQFIIATHSPILMAYPDAWIYECGAEGLRRVTYDETQHVQVTRDFLANPTRTMNELFKE
jgi:predicted ATPase